MNQTITAILGIIQLFFGSNPTVEEVVTVVEQAGAAISAAKAGQAFSVSFPLSVDGVKGSASLSWAPPTAITSA